MGYVQSGIRISGLNDAVAGLKAMGAESEIRKLNLKVGGLVEREARQLVPVRSGALRDSIKTLGTLSTVTVQAGRDPLIPYANPQNWGWFYDRKNFIHKNIKPTQFMNKGAAKVRSRIGEFYMKDLLAIYEKYAGSEYNGKVNLNRDLYDITTRES
jgi:hypothetical protein